MQILSSSIAAISSTPAWAIGSCWTTVVFRNWPSVVGGVQGESLLSSTILSVLQEHGFQSVQIFSSVLSSGVLSIKYKVCIFYSLHRNFITGNDPIGFKDYGSSGYVVGCSGWKPGNSYSCSRDNFIWARNRGRVINT